jgi:hypothetical protein
MILGDLLLLYDNELRDNRERQQSTLWDGSIPDLHNVIDVVAHSHK